LIDSSQLLNFNPLIIDVEEFNASLQGGEALEKYITTSREQLLQSDAAGMVEALSSILPDVDKQILLENSEIGDLLVNSVHEGLRTSGDGWFDDDIAFVEPWGFELSEITKPVILYQGSEDKMVPYAHGEWLAKHLPPDTLRKHLIPGQGHISIFAENMGNFMDELLSLKKE
jgi:pimeloyl-ACP methyl ester carboxylesterase